MSELSVLAAKVGEALSDKGLMLVTAESCTGGGVAHVVTAVAGSSGWFDRGFITYSNASKQEMLGVDEGTLARFGAVSEETVREMAVGALNHSRADVALSVSGIAGPGGGSKEKPVGTVWIGWALRGRETTATCFAFHGGRESVRREAVKAALEGVLARLGHL